MTYLIAEVSALVNSQPLVSRPAPARTWRDRASVNEALALEAALDAIEVNAALDAYGRMQASGLVGAALAGAL